MDFGAIASHARKATADNTPMILTAIGVTGTITTAILAGQASFKAAQVLEDLSPNTENKVKIEQTWKLYIPTVSTGLLSISAIIAANHVSTRRAAALASAYTIAQEGFREYREKVLEKLGEKKEQGIRDEVAQARINRNPLGTFIVSNANALCLDMHSGRYFNCDMETIRKAENDTNFQMIREDYASLTDFWERIGLAKTAESDEIGWNTDSGLNVQYSSALTEKGEPCITIAFRTIPVRGYWSAH